jgi:hypothetical protein
MGKKIGMANTVVGTFLTAYAAWFLLSGPFVDATLPPLWSLFVAVAAFFVGLAMLSWGAKSYIAARRSGERVTPPKGQV